MDEMHDKTFNIEVPLSQKTYVTLTFFGDLPTRREFVHLHNLVDLLETNLLGVESEVKKQTVLSLPSEPKPKVVVNEVEPEKPVKKVRKKREFRQLPPCEKHPDSLRSLTTNRCIACEQETLALMHQRLLEKGQKVQGGAPPRVESQQLEEDHVELDPPIIPITVFRNCSLCKMNFSIESDSQQSICDVCLGEDGIATGFAGEQNTDNVLKEPVSRTEVPEKKFVYSRPVRCPKCGAGAIRLKRSATANLDKDYWVHDREGQDPCLLKIVLYRDVIKSDSDFSASVGR